MGCQASTEVQSFKHSEVEDNGYNRIPIAKPFPPKDSFISEEEVKEEKRNASFGLSEEEAATVIQSSFRGFKARQQIKSVKESDSTSEKKEKEKARMSDENVDNAEKAATKIQATFKGYKVRKDGKQKEDEKEDEGPSPAAVEEEVDIDLTDPQVEKAATKIQATFRGYKSRRVGNDEEEK